jgi:hypothetical protein
MVMQQASEGKLTAAGRSPRKCGFDRRVPAKVWNKLDPAGHRFAVLSIGDCFAGNVAPRGEAGTR